MRLQDGAMQRQSSREMRVAFAAAPPDGADRTGLGRSPTPEIILERRASKKLPHFPLPGLEEDEDEED